MQWYYAKGQTQHGPVDQATLLQQVTPQTLVWHAGMSNWLPVGQVPELAGAFGGAATEAQARPIEPQARPIEPIAYSAPQYVAANAAQGFATASLTLGILSVPFLCVCLSGTVFAILALIFGRIARQRGLIGQTPGAGRALAGIILGWITLGLFAIGAVFNLIGRSL